MVHAAHYMTETNDVFWITFRFDDEHKQPTEPNTLEKQKQNEIQC